MKVVVSCLILLFVFGCKDNEEKPKEKKELIMVKPSEMANLMNEMYAYNLSLKQQVRDGKILNEFPEIFLNIHSAILTDPSDRDSLFEVNSKLFIKTQKALFKSNTDNILVNYNNVVNSCISCHEVTCMGPIPRIKKLYIK
ncbi:hypothetical protein [Seonamhaeicola maritimus]|uniref:Cytochrome c n=1 Tax=Seonamhaeicola maritimus TaxID=2591822 RepID=A0A5C7GFF6_9FLAO|nr:hypothetical protein [Seonamhaeicola maritimus]TXG35210.1 hypothetical protein FUA22_15780 [Seonamhaeicola maritimus]